MEAGRAYTESSVTCPAWLVMFLTLSWLQPVWGRYRNQETSFTWRLRLISVLCN